MKKKETIPPSALKVQEGIDQPQAVNTGAISRLKNSRRPLRKAKEYTDALIAGDRVMLSQAITLVESALPMHQAIAQEIITRCLPLSGNGLRIGITGVPGVGKSTFIEAFGSYLTSLGKKVAVLAVDPSSQRSRGSILGDKTRMEDLARDERAYIRPSPSAGTLGGVARKTRETMVLCEAAGYEVVLIETVGVGQSETAVHAMSDFFLLLMLPGAGDELQGIKRGIMEMADAILINKADGDQQNLARLARVQYRNALHLFPPSPSGWVPKAETCSAISGTGMEACWNMILDYKALAEKSGYLLKKRLEQSRQIMFDTIEEHLRQDFYHHPDVKRFLSQIENDLKENKVSSYTAAYTLLDIYYGNT